MVNSNDAKFKYLLCTMGGFVGGLIGSPFILSNERWAAGSVSTVPCVAPQETRHDADQTNGKKSLLADSDAAHTACPLPPPCPRCDKTCPRCDQAAEPAAAEAAQCPECPECSTAGPATQLAARAADAEGNTVVQRNGPSPAPRGSVKDENYYPLRNSHNRFENWYNNHHTGKGVWKWTQYFPAWERHFAKFIAKSWAGEEVHMAELGIFSGGSLEMWQNVFGPGLRLWGCDIAIMTKQYETDDTSGRTKIFNMDQTDPAAWSKFKKLVPKLDILIDDGLHLFKGQVASFDNIVDHIAPGGVFMTEDISDGTRPGAKSRFNDPPEYTVGKYLDYSFKNTRALHHEYTHTQKTVDSVHYYPYLFVLEKRLSVGEKLKAVKHGNKWKPISRGVVQGELAELKEGIRGR